MDIDKTTNLETQANKDDSPGVESQDIEKMFHEDDKDDGGDMMPRDQEQTFFTDERGNLKLVNLVVRHPCKILCGILVMCFLITFGLIMTVFADGNPFLAPGNEFDIHDVRSIQYDSLRLARDAVQDGRDVTETSSQEKDKQSEVGDFVYWVFESEVPGGVFATRESIQAMKDGFDIFLKDSAFQDWCLLDYRTPVPEGQARNCSLPLSPLRMYYASSWDAALVDSIMDELKVDGRIELFNSLSLCVTSRLYCDLVPKNTTQEDQQWVAKMANDIRTVTGSWNMQGDLVDDISQATEFASYILQLDSFKRLLDIGYDTGFSTENQISQFSRGLVQWGAPLENYTSEADANSARST